MSTLSRWKNRLVARIQLLARAERQVAYWRRRAAERGISSAERARRRSMLLDRIRLLSTRRAQVAAARRVIARHTPKGVSAKAVAMIASFEGGASMDGMFRPYRDVVGVWTIGYGHTKGVHAGSKPLTKRQALALLMEDLNEHYYPPVHRVLREVGMSSKQGLIDGLTSAVYNLGPGVLERGRSLGDAIRTRNLDRIANALLLYDKAGGKTLPGLTRRRRAEAELIRKA